MRRGALCGEEVEGFKRGHADRLAGERVDVGPPRGRHLVDGDCTDGVGKGGEVVEPDDPRIDCRADDDKARVDDEHKEYEAGGAVGDGGGGEEGADHAEDGGDGERGGGEDDDEGEEVACAVCMCRVGGCGRTDEAAEGAR